MANCVNMLEWTQMQLPQTHYDHFSRNSSQAFKFLAKDLARLNASDTLRVEDILPPKSECEENNLIAAWVDWQSNNTWHTMTRSDTAFNYPRMPFGLRIVPGADQQLTMVNLSGAVASLPHGDSTLTFAPDATVFSLWQRELTAGGSPFEVLPENP